MPVERAERAIKQGHALRLNDPRARDLLILGAPYALVPAADQCIAIDGSPVPSAKPQQPSSNVGVPSSSVFERCNEAAPYQLRVPVSPIEGDLAATGTRSQPNDEDK